MKRTLLKLLGRGALFSFAFLLFCYWTFPYERVAAFVVQQVEYPAGPGGVRLPSGYQLQIGSLRPSWLTTVEMENVRLSKSSAHPDVPSGHIAIDELRASVSLFPLLVGEIDAPSISNSERVDESVEALASPGVPSRQETSTSVMLNSLT